MRRLKGALGIGLLWGATWFGAGLLLMVGALLLTGSTGADVPYPIGFGILGFVGGLGFSGLLGVIGSRRRFDELSMPGFAALGATGGIMLATVFALATSSVDGWEFWANLTGFSASFGTGGALAAAGSLALARRATTPDELAGATQGELEPERP
ncbi:MAG: hypothetical protein AAF389_10130 [Gemmatimonadota bacterium]